MTPKMTAGRRLRTGLDAMLQRAREDLGEPELQWDERELDVIGRAVETADRAEELLALFDAEQAGENRPAVLVKISAEVRACDKAVSDLVAKVNPGVGPAKSERHQRAAHARWTPKVVVR